MTNLCKKNIPYIKILLNNPFDVFPLFIHVENLSFILFIFSKLAKNINADKLRTFRAQHVSEFQWLAQFEWLRRSCSSV